jgi:hypothetical protein
MPINIETDEGTLEIADWMVGAWQCHAAWLAELTAATLGCTGIFPPTSDGSPGWAHLPSAVLREFSALLQLQVWEMQGLRSVIGDELPTSERATEEFIERCRNSYTSFYDFNATPLSKLVTAYWGRNFAWSSQHDIRGDILAQFEDEDQLVEALAELLWEHRHQLA